MSNSFERSAEAAAYIRTKLGEFVVVFLFLT